MTKAIRLFAQVLVLTAAFLLTIPAFSKAPTPYSPQGLADGPGIWMNLWSRPQQDLDGYFANLRNHGIRNLYLQVGRSNTEALVRPDEVATLIEYCHKYGIRVIAWGFSQLHDPESDAQKMIQAAEFRTPKGECFDGLAGNLEVNLAGWKVTQYSEKIRQRLGKNYSMIAVVFSPLNKAPQNQYTPWKLLAKYWDVIAPMTYWHGKYKQFEPYEYTVATVQQIRELTEKPDLEIHPIGDGMEAPVHHIPKFLKACRDTEASSASLYPNHKITQAQLQALSRYADHFPSNSRFRIAAYQEIRRSGAIADPPKLNPAQCITRADLYRLVVKQLLPGIAGELSPVEAFQTLMNAGLLPGLTDPSAVHAHLSSTSSHHEAYSLVASVLDLRNQTKQPRVKRRADSWLVQPAMAEGSQQQNAHGSGHTAQPTTPVVTGQQATPAHKALNYLDAAQIVLQARAGL